MGVYMVGLFDLDIVVYRIGSICDQPWWDYKGTRYSSKTELNIVLKEDGVDDTSVDNGIDPVSDKVAKNRTVTYVEEITKDFEDFRGFLSGKGNFRYKVATILPYKGNRSSFQKPYHYDNIRKWLTEIYDVKVSEGREADDEIGLSQEAEETCICTIDKDLDCVPGPHFNWVDDRKYDVSRVQADRSFFKQLLLGDSTDNILGLYGVGPKSAYVKALEKMEDPEEMAAHVYSQYVARFGSYANAFMLENSKLLWILQRRRCPSIRFLKDKRDINA